MCQAAQDFFTYFYTELAEKRRSALMNIGIDIDDTITALPEYFKEL